MRAANSIPDKHTADCREIEAELMERIRAAVLLPVRIDVKDVYDETCTELRVTAALDSGGRGRPRVTYDVTAALANMGESQCRLRMWCSLHLTDMEYPFTIYSHTAESASDIISDITRRSQ